MWVKAIGGVQYLMRGMDVSQYPAASGGKVYGLFADHTLAEYGTAWCPVNFEVGKVYRRRVWVQWFNAQTGAKIAQGSGWDETYFKIVKYHDTWTTFEGVQVTGVAECVYGHMPDLSNVKERYFYGKRKGLVGFIDYNFSPPKQTVMTREQPPSRPAPVSLSWWTRPPLEKPTVPPVNIPEVPGTATAMRVRAVGLRMRASHTTSASVVRSLDTGETVKVYLETETDPIDKFVWVYVQTSKDQGWCAVRGAWGESFEAVSVPKLSLIMPVGCDVVITSRFGVPRDYDGDGILDDKHEGLDVAPSHKNCTPLILAGAAGTVYEVKNAGSYGLHVKLRHAVGAETYNTWYCHMEKAFVKVGDTVQQGDYIGVMGSTGNSTGVHLHLNVQHVGRGQSGYVISDAVDPLAYIQTTQSLSLAA